MIARRKTVFFLLAAAVSSRHSLSLGLGPARELLLRQSCGLAGWRQDGKITLLSERAASSAEPVWPETVCGV